MRCRPLNHLRCRSNTCARSVRYPSQPHPCTSRLRRCESGAAEDLRIDMPRTDTHVLLREREAVRVTHRAREAGDEAVVIPVASIEKKQLRALACWPLERPPSAQNRDSSAYQLAFQDSNTKSPEDDWTQLLIPHSSVSHCDQRTPMTHSSNRSPTTPPSGHV